MRRAALLAVVLMSAGAVAATPQEVEKNETIVTRPSASTGGVETRIAVPSPPPLDNAPRQVTVAGAAGSRSRDSAGAGVLKGVQAREVKSGQARLVLSGVARSVRPGDLIGADLVKSIEAGRMVLSRGAPDGSEAMVVVTFDEAGRGRVRVYYRSDPSAVPPPAVR